MDSLPQEILKQRIAAYLQPSDICQLSTASRILGARLAVSLIPHRKILTQFTRADHRNRFANADHGPYSMDYGFEIPVPAGAACHSVCVSMSWRDQGYGGRKGHLAIISDDKYSEGPLGRIVFASGVAPHSLESLCVTFAPTRDQTYHLWYVVGGGDGHSLNRFEVKVQALVFDDPSRSFLKAHKCLSKGNAFLPWDVSQLLISPKHGCHGPMETLIASTSHLLEQGEEVPPPMLLFFRHYGIPEADLSPKLLNLIGSRLKDLDHQLHNYERYLTRCWV